MLHFCGVVVPFPSFTMPMNSTHLRHGLPATLTASAGAGWVVALQVAWSQAPEWLSGGETSGGRHFRQEQDGEEKGFPKKSKKTSASKPHFGMQLCFFDWSRWWKKYIGNAKKKIEWLWQKNCWFMNKLPFPAGFSGGCPYSTHFLLSPSFIHLSSTQVWNDLWRITII